MKTRLRVPGSYLLQLLLLGASYSLCAKVGLLFAALHLNVSPLWPGAGVALAALVLGGRKLWPAIAIGSLVADLSSSVPLLAAVGNATANSVEAVVGALLLRHLFKFLPTLRRTRDALSLLAVSAVASLVGAAIGIAALVMSETIPFSEAWYNFCLWWFGDALGCFLFAPIIFAAVKSFSWTRRNLAHLTVGVAAVGLVTFISLFHFADHFPFTFILLASVLVALQLRQMGAAAVSVTVSSVSIWAVLHGAANPLELTLPSAAITVQAATERSRPPSCSCPRFCLNGTTTTPSSRRSSTISTPVSWPVIPTGD